MTGNQFTLAVVFVVIAVGTLAALYFLQDAKEAGLGSRAPTAVGRSASAP
ncbi:MAG: hypothetical protein HQL59_04525 [Magnetococcales bacterium]|nr:hypothetical protein [Magnetococcales bacterium]